MPGWYEKDKALGLFDAVLSPRRLQNEHMSMRSWKNTCERWRMPRLDTKLTLKTQSGTQLGCLERNVVDKSEARWT